jgi:hypothetical protein
MREDRVRTELVRLVGALLGPTALVLFGGIFLNYDTTSEVPEAVWILAGAAGAGALLVPIASMALERGRRASPEQSAGLRRVVMIPYLAYCGGVVIGAVGARYALRGADLSPFFQGATPLIGAVLIALVVEGAKSTDRDLVWRLRQAAGLGFILSGAILGVVGLLPGKGYLYACLLLAVWGSLCAATAVMLTLIVSPEPGSQRPLAQAVREARDELGKQG